MSKNYFTDEQVKEIYYSEAGDSIEIGAFEFYKGLFNKAVTVAIGEVVADALEDVAKICDELAEQDYCVDVRVASKAIRALIKRNAKEGE